MLIPLETAAGYLEISVANIHGNPKKFKRFIKNKKFDITAWKKEEKKKQEEKDRKYDALNFADFLIEHLGEELFYQKIPVKYRQYVKEAVKKCKISLRTTKVLEVNFKAYREAYLNPDKNKLEKIQQQSTSIKKQYVPLKERKPLTKDFFKVHYWDGKKSFMTIAKELNVPYTWVWKEYKKLEVKSNGK